MSADILEQILATKRAELATVTNERRLAVIEAAEAMPHPRPFRAALLRPPGAPMRVLAEIKRASPSAGPIRPGADPAEISREYAAGGATAISVLTDKQFFDGDLAYLGVARRACSLPLLRKDFIIDPLQIAEARAAGADAVLLIAAAFPQVGIGLVALLGQHGGVGAVLRITGDAVQPLLGCAAVDAGCGAFELQVG